MAQPKAKTRLEQMGFIDPDIKTPSHDDLIAAFIPHQKWLLDSVYGPSVPGVLSDWKITYKTEVPVTDRNFIIGFLDMKIAGRREFLCDECSYAAIHLLKNQSYQQQRCNEHTVYQASNQCKLCQAIQTGTCGIHSKKYTSLGCRVDAVIEFKTSKFTAGEVLRQMNTYRKYISEPNAFILITSGLCPHKPIIRNEGIHIIEFVNNQWFMNWKSDTYTVYDGELPE